MVHVPIAMLVYRRVVLSTHIFFTNNQITKRSNHLGMSGDVWGMLQRYVGVPLPTRNTDQKPEKKSPSHQVGESLRMQLIKIHAQTTVLYARSEKHSSEKVKFYVPFYRNIYIYIHPFIYLHMNGIRYSKSSIWMKYLQKHICYMDLYMFHTYMTGIPHKS